MVEFLIALIVVADSDGTRFTPGQSPDEIIGGVPKNENDVRCGGIQGQTRSWVKSEGGLAL
jgi:hypothetical protein